MVWNIGANVDFEVSQIKYSLFPTKCSNPEAPLQIESSPKERELCLLFCFWLSCSCFYSTDSCFPERTQRIYFQDKIFTSSFECLELPSRAILYIYRIIKKMRILNRWKWRTIEGFRLKCLILVLTSFISHFFYMI